MKKAEALRRKAHVDRDSTYNRSLAKRRFGQKLMCLCRQSFSQGVVCEKQDSGYAFKAICAP